MPRPRSAMRKIREVLRLSLAEGLSPRQVGIAVGLPDRACPPAAPWPADAPWADVVRQTAASAIGPPAIGPAARGRPQPLHRAAPNPPR